MINPQHVIDFINQLRVNINAGFVQQPMHRGTKYVGEYFTASGNLLSIVFTVFSNKVETKIYDSSRRLIFNDSYAGNINMHNRLIQFLQRSIVTY